MTGGRGELTTSELRSAPELVTSLLPRLDDAAARLVPEIERGARFVGCGSSHLVGGLAATLLRAVGVDADAVVASETAGEVWHPRRPVVAISRSGRTTETLEAVAVARNRGVETVVAVVCDPGSPLAQAADHVIDLAEATEEAVAQTRSVAAELAFALLLSARAGGRSDGVPILRTTLAAINAAHERWSAEAGTIARQGSGRVLVLGGRERWWLAREAVLKLTEMGRVMASAERTLEVPHGPIEGVTVADTVVVLPEAAGPSSRETSVVRRLREVAGQVVVVGVDAFALPHDNPDSGAYGSVLRQLHAAHLLAVALADARGVDADHPARLTPHITLDELRKGEA